MKITYLFLATIIILLFMFGAFILLDYVGLHTLTLKAEDKMIASAWAAFGEVDLDSLAIRQNISDQETRDIYLDKTKATNKIREYIKINFNLDDNYFPKENSFVPVKDHKVLIDEIRIINPDEYKNNSISILGRNIERTSIYISFQIPTKVMYLGNVYKKLYVIVDAKTFQR